MTTRDSRWGRKTLVLPRKEKPPDSVSLIEVGQGQRLGVDRIACSRKGGFFTLRRIRVSRWDFLQRMQNPDRQIGDMSSGALNVEAFSSNLAIER